MKKRINLRIDEGDAVLVGPVDVFNNIADLFEWAAEYEPKYARAYREQAEWVRQSVDQTANVPEDDEY